MKKFRLVAVAALALSLVAAIGLFGCSSNSSQPAQKAEEKHEAVELQIFAANSLQKAMPEAIAAYQKDHSWVTFKDAQYLSSGDLVTKLEGGAQADILITASKSTMDQADQKGLIITDTRGDMFTNELVVVAKKGSDIKINNLADIKNYSLCIGDESVPAGNYARQALSTIGCYEGGTDGKGGQYVGIDPLLDTSVGNVCKHAASGEVDLAIVYSSDVYRFDGVEVVYQIPNDTHKAIVYPKAVCKSTVSQQASEDFLNWCMTDAEAIKIWQAWGFTLA